MINFLVCPKCMSVSVALEIKRVSFQTFARFKIVIIIPNVGLPIDWQRPLWKKVGNCIEFLVGMFL